MTTPGGSAPDGAYVIGSRFGSDQTEAGIREKLRGNAGIAGGGSWGMAQGMFQTVVVGPMLKNELDVKDLDKRVTVLEGVGERIIYTVSQTWTNPFPNERVKVGIGALGGGHGGAQGINQSGVKAIGGRGSSWLYVEAYTDELPASVLISVGSAGGNNGGQGGTSSFGSFLVSNWGTGGILTPQGVTATTSSAGNGGDGPAPVTGAGDPGGSSALAAGGAAGTSSTNGGQGGNAPTDLLAPSGGGGGGGGFGSNTAITAGGAGGFPGGGGGAGAVAVIFTQTRISNGGGGGPGAVFVTVFAPQSE